MLFVPVFSPVFYVYVLRKEFVAVHTVMNKVTGILLIILPLTLEMIDLKYSGAFVSAAATFAAIHEGHLIRTGAGNIGEINRYRGGSL